MEEPTLLTVDQLAKQWQCNPRLVRNLISRGELRSVRLGRLIRIEASAVAQYLERQHAKERFRLTLHRPTTRAEETQVVVDLYRQLMGREPTPEDLEEARQLLND